jgi:hypothetical protein
MEMTKEQWDAKQNASKKKYKYMPTGKPGEVDMVEVNETEQEEGQEAPEEQSTEVELTEQNKSDLKDLASFVASKKEKVGGLTDKMFMEYTKKYPDTSLTKEIIASLKKEFAK